MLTVCPPMTTISDDDGGYIDFSAFELNAEDLVSLASLSGIWRMAVREMRPTMANDPILLDFLTLTEDLPSSLADRDWQQHWVRDWQGLLGSGYAQVDLLRLFFAFVSRCEEELIDGRENVGRVVLALFSCLRRSVIAAVSFAIEMGDEARQDRDGIPGELAALRTLRELLTTDRAFGLLSISVVNRDSYTHLAANDLQHLPAMLATRIADRLRPADKVFIGREGEWLVVLPDVLSLSQPALAATHIGQMLAEPLPLFSGISIMVRATIGAAMLPQHASDPEGALHAARLARWSAGSRQQPFAWFEAGLGENWQLRSRQIDALHKALQQDALELYLQPQVDMLTGQCAGAELLLRWQSSDGTWVPPPTVIRMIEENGWRALYTDWLLRTVMRLASELDAAGIDISLSANFTAGDMADEDLPELIAQCLDTWKLPGQRFTFELTESALLVDRNTGLSIMQRIRALGCRLALDDFGTGYSSLSYLVNLPINEIKIDRSFVVAMSDSAESLRVVRTIVDLTRDLGMLPLAEGVEDDDQRSQLLALGCTAAQGYLYSRPLPLAEFIDWYRKQEKKECH